MYVKVILVVVVEKKIIIMYGHNLSKLYIFYPEHCINKYNGKNRRKQMSRIGETSILCH